MEEKIGIKEIFAAFLALWGSRKLWISIFAIGVMWAIYWHSAYHVTRLADALPTEKLAVLLPILNDMYQVMMWGTVTVAVGFTGFQTLSGFTRHSVGSIITSAQAISLTKKEDVDISVTEKVDPKVVEHYANKYKNDESYAPLLAEELKDV